MSIINYIHTPCKKCVFAKYDNITQTDCLLGLIDRFKEKKVEVLEAYDEEKEFYVINDKKCIGYKEESYFIKRDIENYSIDEKIKYIKNTFKINYLLCVNIKNFSFDELYHLADIIKNLEIKPNNLIFIRYQEDKKQYNYEEIKKILNSCGPIKKWKIKTILNEKEDFINVLHNVTNLNKNNSFVLSVDKSYENISNIINMSQQIVYEDLSTFIVLSNKYNDSIMYNNAVYRYSIAHGHDILANQQEYQIIQ